MATFDHLILNGRPGSGKSELIDHVRGTPSDRRADRYHIGAVVEVDDFVWLWDKFVEDDCWEAIGEPRRFSRRVEGGYVQVEGDGLLDMLIEKLNRVVRRDYLADGGFYDEHTLLLEFARGTPDGGYRHAYELLADDLLCRAAILHIDVSYEESRRRNEARYQEALAHSILAHRLPEESIVRFSAEHDWAEMTGGASEGYLRVRDLRVPFVTMSNTPELKETDALDRRYGEAFARLMALAESR